ncbi:MAG: serine/threonine-protein kinase [Planctomycetota bacterium]
MSEADSRDPVDLLVEQFLQRHRAGESVSAEDFAQQHPDHAAQLLDLLPMMLMLETAKRERESESSGPTPAALPVGLERLGDFRIDGELGRGGMGVVFEAVQESLDRRVALKVLPQASLLTGNQLERFRREAQIAARLHHTNIVPVYGSGESDGYHWYAMQFLNGQSLDRWRHEQSERAPQGVGAWRTRARFVARVGAATAGALHYAHAQGTLHRDIKPGNLMLDHDDHVWVTDFGLAKALEADGLTKSGDLLGTLQYMAPEQFAGQYDVRSEVYALGVTLYELLSLSPAFRGEHRSKLMESVREQRLVPLRRQCPDVPEDLAVVIGKAMARDPGDRYRTAEELEQDLEAFLEDRPIRARRLSTAALLWRWCRRNQAIAALAAGTAAAVLLAAIVGWMAYGVSQDALERVTEASSVAKSEGERAEANLQLSLSAFGNVFDALVGREEAMTFDEDPDTGEATAVVHTPMSPRDVELMQQMLAFYDRFAAQNAASEALQYETARAYRRVGAIQLRLGGSDGLEQAESAFAAAEAALLGIAGDGAQRELAMLFADQGHVLSRQRRPREASSRYRQALSRLEQLPDANKPQVLLDCAKLWFELSRTERMRTMRGPQAGGRPRENRGRGDRDGRGRRAAAGARRAGAGDQELEKAEQILAQLDEMALGAAGQSGRGQGGLDASVRSLRARCLREGARGPDAGRDLAAAREMLRTLVADYPENAAYRFELCEALLAEPRGRRGDLDLSEDRLARLREADALAQRLFQDQPLFESSRALVLRVRRRFGAALYRSARRMGDGSAEAVAAASVRLEEAQQALASAVKMGQPLLRGGLFEPRIVFDVIEAHAALGTVLAAREQPLLAAEQAAFALDVIEDQLEALRRRGSAAGRGGQRQGALRRESDSAGAPPPPRGEGRPSGRGPGRATGRDGRRRGGGAFGGTLGELLNRLDDLDLQARWEAIRKSLGGRERR